MFKEYTFEEWSQLSTKTKIEIWNHYWDPFNPEAGFKTRKAIIEAFKSQYPKITGHAVEIGFGYFGWYVGMIYVIVNKPLIYVPHSFSDFNVNKGKVIKRIDERNIIVSWREYGGSNNKFELKNRKYHTF